MNSKLEYQLLEQKEEKKEVSAAIQRVLHLKSYTFQAVDAIIVNAVNL